MASVGTLTTFFMNFLIAVENAVTNEMVLDYEMVLH